MAPLSITDAASAMAALTMEQSLDLLHVRHSRGRQGPRWIASFHIVRYPP